jgi:hypothetical protein
LINTLHLNVQPNWEKVFVFFNQELLFDLRALQMTVSYNYDACSSTLIGLYRLLFRWRGSVWKAIATEFIIWSVMFVTLSLVLNLVFDNEQQR